MMYFNNGFFGGMHFIWWGLGLFIIAWMLFSRNNITSSITKDEDPLYVLKKRFAKGKIDKDQYEETRRIIISDR